MIHEGSYETTDCLAVVVLLTDGMPDAVNDMSGCSNIWLVDLHLEVAYLSVHGRWHLSRSKRHREIGKESDAIDFKVSREANGIDDGAWCEKYQCAGGDVTLHEIDVDTNLTTNEDAHPVVVDDKRWLILLDDGQENAGVAINHSQFVADIGIFAHLCEMRGQDVPHP